MRKNSIDPFMINNFSNLPRQSKFSSLSTSDMQNEDLVSMTFVEKRTNMSLPKVRTGLVILVTSDSIGENNELGSRLLKSFCESISSGFELPEYIFLMNTGIKIIEDKGVVELFRRLKKSGTNVILSFESLQYFGIEAEYKAFAKWAMGDITSVLVNSKNIIKI